MKRMHKERIKKLVVDVEYLFDRLARALARLAEVEALLDAAANPPKDYIKKAMDDSRDFHQKIHSEMPKWVR